MQVNQSPAQAVNSAINALGGVIEASKATGIGTDYLYKAGNLNKPRPINAEAMRSLEAACIKKVGFSPFKNWLQESVSGVAPDIESPDPVARFLEANQSTAETGKAIFQALADGIITPREEADLIAACDQNVAFWSRMKAEVMAKRGDL